MSVLYCFDHTDSTRSPENRRSKPPDSLDELLAASHIVLGHVTSSTFLERVRRDGLVPDLEGKRTVLDGVPSDKCSVYLLVKWDNFYAQRAVMQHGGFPIVIVVSVARNALKPDENALAVAVAKTLTFDEQLYSSLCLGACRHQGAIPSNKFLGVYNESAVKLV